MQLYSSYSFRSRASTEVISRSGNHQISAIDSIIPNQLHIHPITFFISLYRFLGVLFNLLASTVLGNEVVDVGDVELVSLGGVIVLDLLPGTEELLLL